MKRLLVICVLLAGSLWAADKPGPILPQAFAGWQQTAPKASSNPADADPANAALLAEYGFTGFEGATYTKPGRTLKIKAARFKDRSAAYGAFTFYKTPEMITEQIGDQASSLNEHVLFYRGNVLIEAVFDRETAMSAAELRELADDLAVPNEEVAKGQPPIIEYIPRQSYVKNSVKYVVGPVGMTAVGAPLQPDLVDFSKAPEVALAKYNTPDGVATLTIIAYPTPQIAAERLRAINAALDNKPDAHTEQDNFLSKRTGPLVIVVTGAIPSGEAKSLLASIGYEADVTWNEATKLTARDNIGNLIWNVFKLIGFLLLVMFVLGALYAGSRMAMRRWLPNYQHDPGGMIRLDIDGLDEELAETPRPTLPTHASK
jgi:hypothetical protein